MTVFWLSLPGLGRYDLERMPQTARLVAAGDARPLHPHFPCVTWPVQANFVTGCLPNRHGVVANGFFWRDRGTVEMWTAGNEVIQAPQIWDRLHQHSPRFSSAVWFPMLAKRCGADLVCMPAPIHRPDGTESLWCYTKPEPLYEELLERFGHFPLQHFWGPLANIESSRWIARTAAYVFEQHRPDFFFVYLPHLDYAAQKAGPESDAARGALGELDAVIGELGRAVEAIDAHAVWLITGEYAITPASHVTFPNRILREAGWLAVREDLDGREVLDLQESRAWALVDHQCAHVFVRDADGATVGRIADCFRNAPGIAEVLTRGQLGTFGLDHERSGDIVLVSTPDSWQAYYWWWDDDRAPAFARTVDIHRKPGYDPVELFWDPKTQGVPLEPERVKGSHGAPVGDPSQETVVACSRSGILEDRTYRDTDVASVAERLIRTDRSGV